MRAGAPILIVSYTFPPYKGIGGRRWMKFAKALALRGHPVHVLHSRGPEALKGSLWTEDLSTPGLHLHALPQRYPTVLFKRPLTRFTEKLGYHFHSRLLPLLTRGNWLDKTVFWRQPFLAKAGALIRTHGIEQVIITGAPFRLCAYGVELKERHAIRLTCDLRDPWTWHHGYGSGSLSPARQAHEQELEERMMHGADHITSPHPSVVEHLQTRYPDLGGKVHLLPHAIDPDELGAPLPPRQDGDFRLIYAGSLYGAEEAEAYFAQLIAAFEALRDRYPEQYARTTLDLHITGHGVDAYRSLVKAHGLEERIRFQVPLPPRRIAERIATSDAVLTFIPSFNKDLLGTKFNETFYLRRPVIHVGAAGVVSRYIETHRLGTSIPVEALATELPRIIRGERSIAIDPTHDLSPHLLANITERFVREVLS